MLFRLDIVMHHEAHSFRPRLSSASRVTAAAMSRATVLAAVLNCLKSVTVGAAGQVMTMLGSRDSMSSTRNSSEVVIWPAARMVCLDMETGFLSLVGLRARREVQLLAGRLCVTRDCSN